MQARTLIFAEPGRVEVEERDIEAPGAGEVRVDTLCSAVSPGTERLIYRGEAPDAVAADSSIDALGGGLSYPMTYGYACVGRVAETGPDVSDDWLNRRVFAFHPHADRFVTDASALIPVPDDVSDDAGAMIPNVETATTLVMDGQPMIGETVVVFGQGVVGLLTTALLSRHPLGDLAVVDLSKPRRERALSLGADHAFSGGEAGQTALLAHLGAEEVEAREASADGAYSGSDLVYELTGRPGVLDRAVRAAGFDARVVVGSWYGTKTAPLDLGSRFHRSRMDIRSSQVSTVDPRHRGRWTKARRMQTVLDAVATLQPDRLVSHRIPIEKAHRAYDLLNSDRSELIQPLITYT